MRQSIHLLTLRADSAAAAPAPRPLIVPDGASVLGRAPDGAWWTGAAADAAGARAAQRRADLEVVCRAVWPAPRLLLARATRPLPRLNGGLPVDTALLREGDELQWDDDDAGLAVAVYTDPEIGPPPPHLAGHACPVCHAPVEPGQSAYTCPCNTLFHLDTAGLEDERRECAAVPSACPVCQRTIQRQPGYGRLPEGVAP